MTKIPSVDRHLKFAWIELQECEDGIIFHDSMTRRLGWRNIFASLPAGKGKSRIDTAHPNILIVWKSYKNSSGLLLMPDIDVTRENFLQRWIFSPGVKAPGTAKACLTYDSDADVMAEIVCVSGHGTAGVVSGEKLGIIDIARAIDKNQNPDGGKTHKPALKYLIIPACGCVGENDAALWLPAFTKVNGIRGLLGYKDKYPGGETGAGVMARFVGLMKGGSTILDAWKGAHEGKLAERWGAILHPDAQGDNMKDWMAGKLAPLGTNKEPQWIWQGNYPDGAQIKPRKKPEARDVIVNFYVGDTKVSWANNDMLNESTALTPCAKGRIEMISKNARFGTGAKCHLIFYFYRENKSGMNLAKLLQFDSKIKSRISLIHRNDSNRPELADTIRFFPRADEQDKIVLPFTVHPKAAQYYPCDSAAGTHGRFWVRFEESLGYGLLQAYQFKSDGMWLRPGSGNISPSAPDEPEEAPIILFDSNLARIKGESYADLDGIVQGMKNDDTLKYSIEGHTDSSGSPAGNLNLSSRRAAAVKNYIIGKGIRSSRLRSKGWGDQKPIASNDTEEGKAKNRRVEFVKLP